MILIFDIGGTKTRINWITNGANSFEQEPIIFDTPKLYSDFLLLLNKINIPSRHEIQKIIIGVPGAFDKNSNKLGSLQNLPDWSGRHLNKDISDFFKNTNIEIHNDTKLVGLGEFFFGAGKNLANKRKAYITISTGVNGFFIDENSNFSNEYSPEIGHMIIDYKNYFTWENAISGTAMSREFACDILKVPDYVWKDRAKIVALGIYNLNLFWQPEVIIIGGSMVTKEIGFKINDIESEFNKLPKIYPHNPVFLQATLKSLGGLYGGLYLANQNIN